MDDIFFYMDGGSSSRMSDANWWFLMSPHQKRQHLYVDSNVSDEQISLILRTYGEEEESIQTKEV